MQLRCILNSIEATYTWLIEVVELDKRYLVVPSLVLCGWWFAGFCRIPVYTRLGSSINVRSELVHRNLLFGTHLHIVSDEFFVLEYCRRPQ